MSDVRLVQTTAPTAPKRALPPAPAAAAPGPAPATPLGQDSYKPAADRQRSNALQALDTLNQALVLAPMPTEPAAKAAWLQASYGQLAKADLAQETLDSAAGRGVVDNDTVSAAVFKKMDVEDTLAKADPTGAGEKTYYAALAAPALAIIDDLANIPAPPESKVAKQQWLMRYGGRGDQAEAARNVLSEAWMHKGATFDQIGDANDKIFKFQCTVDSVKDAVNPPAPRAAGSRGWTPFADTQGVANMLDKHKDPISQTAGAVALPFAMMLDMLDLVAKPLQALDRLNNPAAK